MTPCRQTTSSRAPCACATAGWWPRDGSTTGRGIRGRRGNSLPTKFRGLRGFRGYGVVVMAFGALLGKDLRRELRSKEALLAGLLLVALAFLAALFADPAHDGGTLAALLWTPLLFATVALVGRGFASEFDRGTIQLLRAAPVPLAWHGWSRTLVHMLVTGVVAATALAVAAALFAFDATMPLVATLAFAAVGLAIVGTLASAISAQARTREVLLPVLL